MSFNCIRDLNKEVMKFTENDKMLEHPKVHYGLNGIYLAIRSEITAIEPDLMMKRKTRLRQLMVQDYLLYDKELREVDKAFIETQY